MKQINRRRQRQYKNFLFAKMLLDFLNDVFRESVGECVFWLWWFAMLENCDHDKTSANTTYARHAGRQSTADERQRGEDDERERTRSGGMASEVSSGYDANGNVIFEKDLPEGMTLEDDSNTVALSRVQTIRENVFAIDEGWGLFANDTPSASASGKSRNSGRTYTWNERNQLVSTVDYSRSTAYVYDYNGVRVNKYTARSETLYFNQFYAMRFDNLVGYGSGQAVKHIYLGDTRIVTKLNTVRSGTWSEEVKKQYFYHSDHLGSASLISDCDGKEYQRIEYTPYGETWVEKTQNTGMEYLPYKFTGKERDEETGLYYFGARYLDAQYSRWMSTDPALGEYVPQVGGDNSRLPAGGLFNIVNLNVYHYGANNPIRYTDPNGMHIDDWQDNGDGTWTVKKEGATLWDVYGAEWEEKSGYEGDPRKLQVGDTVGKKNEWHVKGEGHGVGVFASSILFYAGGEIDKSWFDMTFTIEETGESFSGKFTSIAVDGSGVKIGAGAYVATIEAKGFFEGKKPDKDTIFSTFSGPSDVIGVSLLLFGITGSENKNWTVNTGTFGFSKGLPFSLGSDKSVTRERK